MAKIVRKTKVTSSVISNTGDRVSIGGVYYRSDKKRYVARFTLNGIRINVGSFLSERKAKQELKRARSQYYNWL